MPPLAIPPPRSSFLLKSALLICLMIAGCGEEVPAPTAESTPPPKESQATETSRSDRENSLSSDHDPRTKWVGEIPYDVFFDRPLEVATEGSPTDSIRLETGLPRDSSADEAVPVAATPDTNDTPNMGTTSSTDGTPVADWQRLASIDVLNEEVKQLRNRLTTHLKTVATYNRNVEAVANDSVVLAAMAAVIGIHPGSLSWQANASFVRDLAASVGGNATETGREPYSAAQRSFEQIISILNGGPPPQAEAAASVPFSDVADRSELMKRTKRSFDWLKSEINTSDRFSENRDDIIREATVLAVFGGLISTDGYDSADEPKYQQLVREFVDANLAINAAVEAANYEQFTIARDRVQNACAACHGEYAFGDEGI